MFTKKTFVVFCFLSLGGIACKSNKSSQLLSDSSQPQPGVSAMGSAQKTQVMSAAAAAAYCENGNDTCKVSQVLNEHLQFYGLSAELTQWKAIFLSAVDPSKSVKGYLFFKESSDDVIIAMRGTATQLQDGAIQNLLTDLSVNPKRYEGPKVRGGVHSGFLEAVYGIWHPNESGLVKVINDNKLAGKKFWVTGHSMGGSLAALVAMRLAEENHNVAGVYTFGAPRLADYEFQASYNALLGGRVFQFVNREDPIPHIPNTLVAVGDVIRLKGGPVEKYGKDGADGWDYMTAASQGVVAHHNIIERNGASYPDSIKASQGL